MDRATSVERHGAGRGSSHMIACAGWSAAIAAIVFAAAFLLAPQACEGGLEIYFWCGVAALTILLGLPFVLRTGQSLLARIAWALGLVAFGIGVWLGGLLAADMRIICRLF